MKFHPSPELLVRYSAGTISPAMSFVLAMHIKHCDACKEQQGSLEAFGGVSIENSPHSEMADHAFEALMGLIDDDAHIDALNPGMEEVAIATDYMPILERLVNGDYSDIEWQHVAKKISHAELAIDDQNNKIELLKFEAGAKIPSHTHKGNEFTVILEGSYSDEMGDFVPGDFIHLTENHHHKPVAGDKGCVCIAVTDAPMQFTGPIGPILNYFTGVA